MKTVSLKSKGKAAYDKRHPDPHKAGNFVGLKSPFIKVATIFAKHGNDGTRGLKIIPCAANIRISTN